MNKHTSDVEEYGFQIPEPVDYPHARTGPSQIICHGLVNIPTDMEQRPVHCDRIIPQHSLGFITNQIK